MSFEPKWLSRALGAVVITGGLGLGVAGAAAAVSSSSGPSAHHAQTIPAPQPSTSPTTGQDQGGANSTPPGEKVETPDPGETQKAEAPDKSDAAEKGSEAEPATDPEPNHQDPDGANVDHTPAGEKPEVGRADGQR